MLKTTRHTTAYAVNLAKRRTWHGEAAPSNSAEREARTAEILQQQQAQEQAKRLRNDFEQPRYFATIGEAYAHEADSTWLNYVKAPANDALAKLERIATDERLSDKARSEDFGAVKREALEAVEQHYDGVLSSIAERIPQLEAKARRPLTPTVDAAALNYVRDTLQGQARAGVLKEYQIEQKWQQALDEKDKVTLQVLFDNAASFIRSAREPRHKNAPMSKRYDELHALTDDALRTPEQRQAAQELKKLEATRWQARREHLTATNKLKNAAYGPRGLVDRADEQRRSMIRNSW